MRFRYLLLIILVGCIIWGIWAENALERQTELHRGTYLGEPPVIQGNSLIPISPVYVPPILLYGSLISCLEWHESKGDKNAYNPKDIDGYPKYGLLQFHKPTFQQFCVDKYRLPDKIFSPIIQKICADMMIDEGYGYLWGTWKKCYY